jgi:hypothetical protein
LAARAAVAPRHIPGAIGGHGGGQVLIQAQAGLVAGEVDQIIGQQARPGARRGGDQRGDPLMQRRAIAGRGG